MSACVIFNPTAGGGYDAEALRSRLSCLPDCEVRETTESKGPEELASQAVADGFGLIVSGGGDGTLNGVLNGIAPHFSRVTLGVLPLGTANDFCRSIGVADDLDEAIGNLCARRERPLDVARVTSAGTRHFINVAAAGFSGLLHEKLTPEIKQAWGPLAYVRSGIATLPDLSEHETTLILDDSLTLDATSYNVIVANARFAAGGLPVAPQAILDDGQLDIIIVPAASLPRLAQLAPLVITGQHLESELVSWHRASRVEMSASPGMWLNVDGESQGNEPAVFELLPRALRVVVGSKLPDGALSVSEIV